MLKKLWKAIEDRQLAFAILADDNLEAVKKDLAEGTSQTQRNLALYDLRAQFGGVAMPMRQVRNDLEILKLILAEGTDETPRNSLLLDIAYHPDPDSAEKTKALLERGVSADALQQAMLRSIRSRNVACFNVLVEHVDKAYEGRTAERDQYLRNVISGFTPSEVAYGITQTLNDHGCLPKPL